jgi:hypothetical protein
VLFVAHTTKALYRASKTAHDKIKVLTARWQKWRGHAFVVRLEMKRMAKIGVFVVCRMDLPGLTTSVGTRTD